MQNSIEGRAVEDRQSWDCTPIVELEIRSLTSKAYVGIFNLRMLRLLSMQVSCPPRISILAEQTNWQRHYSLPCGSCS